MVRDKQPINIFLNPGELYQPKPIQETPCSELLSVFPPGDRQSFEDLWNQATLPISTLSGVPVPRIIPISPEAVSETSKPTQINQNEGCPILSFYNGKRIK